jgi:hypothetical protein
VTRVIGHGRYSGEVYPEAPATAASPPDPENRVRAIDSASTGGLAPLASTTVGPFTCLPGEVPLVCVGEVVDPVGDPPQTWSENPTSTLSWVLQRNTGDATRDFRITFTNNGGTATMTWRYAVFGMRWFPPSP